MSDTTETQQTAEQPAEDDGSAAQAGSLREDSPPPEDGSPRDDGSASEGAELRSESIVEAVLFAADAPLPAAKLAEIVPQGTARDVKQHIDALNEAYEQQGRSFRIEQIAGGYQMLTLPAYNRWLGRMRRARQEGRLSQAALEILAVVAYKQPVLRADVEAIRGVACGELLNRLRELNLIKIVGRAEDIGRPMLYGTTKRFLEVFGLGSLEDLPKAEELTPPSD